MLLGKHVHGATLAPANACFLAKELSHDLFGRHILAQCMHVIAICGAHIVISSQQSDDARGDSFLQQYEAQGQLPRKLQDMH